jgi:hypothetical protein
MSAERVYYPYSQLEEHQAGMWRQISGHDRHSFVALAADLMRVPDRFYDAMLRAVEEWPRSCEMALTTPGLNRRAWMGHAGCCIATGSPEELTRLAWHTLTRPEQELANLAADDAIAEWERRYRHADNLSLF